MRIPDLNWLDQFSVRNLQELLHVYYSFDNPGRFSRNDTRAVISFVMSGIDYRNYPYYYERVHKVHLVRQNKSHWSGLRGNNNAGNAANNAPAPVTVWHRVDYYITVRK